MNNYKYNYEYIIKTRPDNKFFDNFNLKNCDMNRINGTLHAYYGPPRKFLKYEIHHMSPSNFKPTPVGGSQSVKYYENHKNRDHPESTYTYTAYGNTENDEFILQDQIFIVPGKLADKAFDIDLSSFDNKGFWYAELVQGLLFKYRKLRLNIIEIPSKVLKLSDPGRTIIRPESNMEFKRGRLKK